MYEDYERIPSHLSQSTDDDSGFSSSLETLSSGYDPTDVENVYSMDHKRRGHLAIFNNGRFEKKTKCSERIGTDKDATNICYTFEKLGFEIKTYTDLSCLEMLNQLIEYADMNHEDCDCFAVVILSHGGEGYVYGKDGKIDVKDLVAPLTVSKTLFGKPKLFFIQACQGSELDDGNECSDAEVDRDKDNTRRLLKHPDFLYSYSTFPGFLSFRNKKNGSVFIQAIAKIFKEHGNKLDITRLLTRVNREVAIEFKSRTDIAKRNNKKQMPCVVSTLTKDLHFPLKKSQ